MRPLSMLSLVLVAALTPTLTACEEPCRHDADCETTAGLTRCDVDTGTCGPLELMGVTTCTDSDDCQGGRVCADGECHFAPSCQTISDGTAFDYIARCSDGEVASGTATATTNGCKVQLALSDVFGAPLNLVLEPISSLSAGDAEVSTSSDGQIACATGTWNAPASGASLPACQLPGGLTCDVGVLRRGAGPICLADGTGCDAASTCEPFGPGVYDVGGCR